MIRALGSAAQGLRLGQAQVDAVAHNLANLQTPGFKAVYVQGADLIYSTFPGTAAAPRGIWPLDAVQLGVGSRVLALRRDLSQGIIFESGGALDLALTGPGYFMLEGPAGERVYTRDGSFRLDAGGRIVSYHGYPLLSNGGPVPPMPECSRLVISPDGTITAWIGEKDHEVGHLLVAAFPSPEDLLLEDDGTYRVTVSSGPPRFSVPGEGGSGEIKQGCLEAANTDLAVEMVSAIIARRAYEFSARGVRALDEMWRTANDIKA